MPKAWWAASAVLYGILGAWFGYLAVTAQPHHPGERVLIWIACGAVIAAFIWFVGAAVLDPYTNKKGKQR